MADNDATIDLGELCELTGLSDRRIQQIAKAGWFPQSKKGEFDRKLALQGLFRYYRESSLRKSDDIKAADSRYKSARADKTEIERDQLRGTLVLRQELGPALRSLALTQRSHFQQKLEREMPAKLAGKTEAEILELNQATVDSICKIFEEGIRQWLDTP